MDYNPIGIAFVSMAVGFVMVILFLIIKHNLNMKQNTSMNIKSDSNDSAFDKVMSVAKSEPSIDNKIQSKLKELNNHIYRFKSIVEDRIESKWTSEYDKDVLIKIDRFSGDDGTFEVVMYLFDHKNDISTSLMRYKNNRIGLQYDVLVDENPELKENVLLHLNSALGQIIAKTKKKEAKLLERFKMDRKVRIWYIDAEDAQATYPQYKKNFKFYNGTDEDYTEFNARFIFTAKDADINDIINKFPDADLIELYDEEDKEYKSYDMEEIKDIFIF